MGNHRLVWGLNIVLAAAVLLLTGLLIKSNSSAPQDNNGSAPQEEDRVIAAIGNHTIRMSELQLNLMKKYGSQVLDEMLDRYAIKLEAEEHGIIITDSEIQQELMEMSRGYESEEDYYRSMKQQLGLDKEDIIEDIRYKLLLEKLAIRDIPVTEEEVDQFLQNNNKDYADRVHLRIAQIITFTEEQAAEVLALYRQGHDFAELAKTRSVDTFSAIDGGDLGWLEDDDPFVDPAILQSASQLEVGEVSAPIQLNEGFAVIKLTNRRVDSLGDEEQIRSKARKELSLQKAPPLREVISMLRKKRNAITLEESLNS
ncbi:peptidylprolyl isomerase [Paenibacillus senegalensis]|uniref:peptidylprolyl isomerase n=1 Tax=Paenibacillus senegalensis TaxID=1465766 RepID=UPI00028967F9|nr:peptidylprolyl isomerase [Paenibacillus senegalensis]